MSIAAKGWDHKLFRLGADLAVRLPRRAASAALVEQEQRWLPSLAARLPLPIPVPHRVGSPTDRYPWSWSVVPWFQGATALSAPLDDRAAAVRSLGGFLRALHHPAPPDAPRNPWRDSLASRTPLITERLTRLDTLVNGAAVIDLWNRVLSTPSWSGPRVWNHGDLHPGNLLVTSGRLSAVIDFGDLTRAIPPSICRWRGCCSPITCGQRFARPHRNEFSPIDDDTWMRARGWALTLGLAYWAFSRDDDAMQALGRATMDAALDDESSIR